MNSKDEIRLRKYRSNLYVAGKSYILFGVWSIAKIFLTYTMQKGMFDDYIESMYDIGIDDSIVMIVGVLCIIIVALFAMSLHLWTGLGAIRYANEKKRGLAFLFPGALIFVLTIVCTPLYFVDQNGLPNMPGLEDFASMFVDYTVLFIFVDIVFSIIKINRCYKKIINAEAQSA